MPKKRLVKPKRVARSNYFPTLIETGGLERSSAAGFVSGERK
jgi:hypothetical protein